VWRHQQLAQGRPLFGVALDRFQGGVELAEMGLGRGAFEDLRDRRAGSVTRLARPRSWIDTSVQSEPIRQEPGAAAVENVREHGGEPATASVMRHTLTYRVRLLKL